MLRQRNRRSGNGEDRQEWLQSVISIEIPRLSQLRGDEEEEPSHDPMIRGLRNRLAAQQLVLGNSSLPPAINTSDGTAHLAMLTATNTVRGSNQLNHPTEQPPLARSPAATAISTADRPDATELDTVVPASPIVSIPRSLHLQVKWLRFIGPHHLAMLFPVQLDLLCETSLVPEQVACAIGYTFGSIGWGRNREIFPIIQPRPCITSSGTVTPRFFIRDFGIIFRPESEADVIRMTVRLMPTPDLADDASNMAPVWKSWSFPYIILGRDVLRRVPEGRL